MRTINEVVRPRNLDYRVLLNKVDPRVPGHVVDAAALLDGAGLARFRGYIRQYKIHTTSPIDGRVVTQYPHDRSADRGSEDFRKVALELFANWANASDTSNVKAVG